MNNKKTIIALLLIAIIGIVGLTIAYFANSTSIDNTFITKEYGTTYEETFVSPDNWLPGDTTPKSLVATNTGEVDQAVRVLVTESWTTDNDGTLNGWIHSDGTKSNHTTQSELETDERVAILNLANTSDWTKVGNYYYYNYKLVPTESTTSFLESVTFNPKTKLDDTCTTTTNNGVTTTTCNSSGDDYDNATYTLTLTIETVQYNKYATAWSTNVEIGERTVPGAQYLLDNATNPANTVYSSETKGKMFAFSHEATYQTPSQTDYRYIGDDPNNYVYFNCDDMANQSSSTCEVWRILGVFDVDDGTGNVEQRMKLVRESAFTDEMVWDENGWNDWTNASLKNFLNGDYYNRNGDASAFGLKASAREMVGDTTFYLGGNPSYDSSTEEMYILERSINTYNNSEWCIENPNDESCDTIIPTNWNGKVGLMYPSDFYISYYEINNACYTNPASCNLLNEKIGWIFLGNKLEGQNNNAYLWFMTPYSEDLWKVFYVNDSATLDVVYHDTAEDLFAVRPVVYLKSSVEIDSGTGTELDPYKLTY